MPNDRASSAEPGAPATAPATARGATDLGPRDPLLVSAVHGARWVEPGDDRLAIARLSPHEIRYAADDGIRRTSAQLSGVHLRFSTAAEWIELDVHVTRSAFAAPAHRWRPAVFQAVVEGVETDRASLHDGTRIVLTAGAHDVIEPGVDETVRLRLGPAGGPREIRVWLPHNAAVDLHCVRASAPLAPAAPSVATRWVHYGSSISHCASTDLPREVWPVLAADALGWDVTSLGLSGQAMLDPFVARAIADTPADLISLKVGINLVNAASMTQRTFTPALHGFLDIVRERHPETPIILFSPIACPMHESTPGPTVALDDVARAPSTAPAPAGALTLGSIRAAIETAVRVRADPALWFVDGRELLGDADAGFLFDNLHPDTAGYRLMAERFAGIAAGAPWAPSGLGRAIASGGARPLSEAGAGAAA